MEINQNLKTSVNSPLRQSISVVESNMIGHVSCFISQISNGASLEIGKRYTIQELLTGDDFSNVGYVADETTFVATATTPLVWTADTEVFLHDDNINIIINSIDPNAEIYSIWGDKIEFKLTNGGFVTDKTYPDMNSLNSIQIIDENTIRTQTGTGFFKIEVYS